MTMFLSRTAMRWEPLKTLAEEKWEKTDGHTCVPIRFFFILHLIIRCRRNDRVAFRRTLSVANASPTAGCLQTPVAV